MNKTPLLSVIMPVYNVESYLPRAIKSVISQTFTDWELIIVIDGSPDCCGEIALQYASTDRRLKVFSKENGGLSDARNFGLEKATGRWIHFFDSDDWIDSTYYESMISHARGCDILISGYKVDYETDGTRTTRSMTPVPVEPWRLVGFINNFINFAWNKLFSRSFLEINNLLFEKGLNVVEDLEFMSRCIKVGAQLGFCHADGYHYRVDDRPSLSRSFSVASVMLAVRSVETRGQMLDSLLTDDGEKVEVLEYAKYIVVRNLLHALHNYGDAEIAPRRREWTSQILHTPELRLSSQPSPRAPMNLTDRILWRLIAARKVRLLNYLYRMRHRFNRR